MAELVKKFGDKHPPLDWTASKQIFDDAMKVRERFEARLVDEPVFIRMRETHDLAERKAKPLPPLPKSIVERHTAARQKLMAGMRNCSVRTKSSSASSSSFSSSSSGSAVGDIFKSSVTTAPGEKTVRVLIQGDAVRPELETNSYKTAFTVDLRPHSADSWAKKRREFCDSSSQQVFHDSSVKGKHPSFILTIKVKLKKNTPHDDVNFLQEFLEKELFRGDREVGEIRVVDEADGGKYGYFHFGRYDASHDPVATVMREIARKIGVPRVVAERLDVSDIVRCGTLTFELPFDFGDIRDSASITPMSLTENARIAAELVVRENIVDCMSQRVLGRQVLAADRFALLFGACCAAMMPTTIQLHLRISPLELCFARAVRDLGCLSRAGISKAKAEKEGDGTGRLTEQDSRHFAELLGTTAAWEGWAAALSRVTGTGLNPQQMRYFFFGAMAGGSLKYSSDDSSPAKGFISDKLISMLQHLERLEKIHFTGPGVEVDFTAKRGGLTSSLMSVVPKSRQECLDLYSKPVLLAGTLREGEDIVDLIGSFRHNSIKSGGGERSISTSESNQFPGGAYHGLYQRDLCFSLQAAGIEAFCSGGAAAAGSFRISPFMNVQRSRPVGGSDAPNGKKKLSCWDFSTCSSSSSGPIVETASSSNGSGMQTSSSSGSFNPASVAVSGDLPAAKISFLQDIFSQFDFSGDGLIDRGELMACVCTVFPSVPATECWSRAMDLQLNEDAKLNFEQFVQVLKFYL